MCAHVCSSAGVTRETFAVFMEPNFDQPMDIPKGRSPEDAQTQRAAERLPKGVTPLASRWQVGMDFGSFTDRTLNAFH
jgi:isopenicillin N synthase-like dioxygenase